MAPALEEDRRLLGLEGLQVAELAVEGNTLFFVHPLEQLGEEEYLIRLVSPSDAEFAVPEHFHPHLAEHLRCLSGRLQVFVNGERHELRPEDGEFTIPAGAVHRVLSPRGEHSVCMERTGAQNRAHSAQVYELSAGQAAGTLSGPGAFRLFYQYGEAFPALSTARSWLTDALAWLLVYTVGGGMYHLMGPHRSTLGAGRKSQ